MPFFLSLIQGLVGVQKTMAAVSSSASPHHRGGAADVPMTTCLSMPLTASQRSMLTALIIRMKTVSPH